MRSWYSISRPRPAVHTRIWEKNEISCRNGIFSDSAKTAKMRILFAWGSLKSTARTQIFANFTCDSLATRETRFEVGPPQEAPADFGKKNALTRKKICTSHVIKTLQNTIARRSAVSIFIFYQVQKFWSSKKLWLDKNKFSKFRKVGKSLITAFTL